tara:strand:+ start:320 stop:442 length:123 start_codon:yes stop_codon:yes gene_type:complete
MMYNNEKFTTYEETHTMQKSWSTTKRIYLEDNNHLIIALN